MPWREDDVEAWLTTYPLPADFTWQGEKVWPRKQLREGYGQWLRTAGSYHPALRGLFRLVCEIVIAIPDGQPMPTPEQLAAKLRDLEGRQGTLAIDVPPAAARPPGSLATFGDAWPNPTT